MDDEIEEFCFESDIKDVPKVKVVEDNREVKTEVPYESTVKIETNPDEKHVCVVCNQRFDKFELELHFLECIQDQSESQAAEKGYNLEAAASNFSTGDKFEEKGKLHKCRFCPKEFSRCNNLKRHERIHTGEKPFKCKFCEKSFAQRSGLKVHERIHTGEKPFKCKHCTKAFQTSGSLIVHERIHTGEKPFKCKYCPKSFGHTSDLKRHVQIHIGETISRENLIYFFYKSLKNPAKGS